MGAWGHRIVELPMSEVERLVVHDLEGEAASRYDWPRPRSCCGVPRCDGLVTHYETYQHITGRRGRVGIKHRRLCTRHATASATKHGVTIEAAIQAVSS